MIYLLFDHEKEPYWDRSVTGKKWIVYDNVLCKWNWKQSYECAEPVPKAGLYRIRLMGLQTDNSLFFGKEVL